MRTPPPTIVTRGSFVAIALILTIFISACSIPTAATNFPAGGYTVDVPVLWVGTQKDGTEVGGVEDTQVWTGTSKIAGYSVDLNGIEAEGAGDAWRAASASAATMATLISGTDPNSVDIQFHISAPIDGPSAGGILTVALLASLREISLKAHVTMTGTISPDGSIGPIGGAFSKVTAAAQAGFTSVVIPASNRASRNPVTHEEVDLVPYGQSLGITVVPVAQLAEAFFTLTGTPLLTSANPESAAKGTSAAANTTNLNPQRLRNVTDLLDTTAALSTANPDPTSSALIGETHTALNRGELPLASGLSREAFLAQWRQTARNNAQKSLSGGIAAAQKALAARAESVRERAVHDVSSATELTGLTDSQYASMPEMLVGVVTAQATVESLQQNLPGLTSEADVIRASDILADQEAAIDEFFPRDLALLMEIQGPIEIRSENPVAFLSNYTNFLVRSGDANMRYLTTVIRVTDALNTHTIASFDTMYPVLVMLAETTARMSPAPESLAAELTEATYGLALYVNSGALVTNVQALGLFETGIGRTGDVSQNIEATRTSIGSGLATVTALATLVDARGWDVAYPLAQARAGAAFASNQLSEHSSTDSVSHGLQRLWAASITVYLMQAAPA